MIDREEWLKKFAKRLRISQSDYPTWREKIIIETDKLGVGEKINKTDALRIAKERGLIK